MCRVSITVSVFQTHLHTAALPPAASPTTAAAATPRRTYCCDPGAICSNRQCFQPTAPNCRNPSGFGGSSPTSNPARSPPLLPTLVSTQNPALLSNPTTSAEPNYNSISIVAPNPVAIYLVAPSAQSIPSTTIPICQFGGYCRADSDCVPGNKCNVQSQYYSQCIPDSSAYRSSSTGCISDYGSSCNSASDLLL